MSHIERPEMSIASWPKIEKYTLDLERNEKVASFMWNIVGRTFNPTVHYQPGARPAIAKALVAENTTVALAPIHRSFFDPLTLVGYMWDEPMYTEHRYDAAIPSKLDLFTMLGGKLCPMIESVGAYPAFRPSDAKGSKDRELLATLSDAIESTKRLNQTMMIRHKLFGIYPQITRAKSDDQTKVEGTTKVLGNAIVAIRNQRRVVPVPIGVVNDEGINVNRPSLAVTRPTYCVGNPIDCDSKDPAEITGLVEEGIRENTLWASELHAA